MKQIHKQSKYRANKKIKYCFLALVYAILCNYFFLLRVTFSQLLSSKFYFLKKKKTEDWSTASINQHRLSKEVLPHLIYIKAKTLFRVDWYCA